MKEAVLLPLRRKDMRPEADLIPYEASPLPPGPYLVFAPHPDDETFGMGGTIALAAEADIPVSLVILTDGAIGGDAGIRKGEAEAAAQVLGITEVHFWGIPDRHVQQAGIPCDRVSALLEGLKPATVFLPGILEFHPDHRATTDALVRICRAISYGGAIWLYEISRQGEVNRLVDITRSIDRKIEAIRCYGSQISRNNYESVSLGLAQARSYTLPPEVTHAEGFWALDGPLDRAVPLSGHQEAVSRYAAVSNPEPPLVSIIIRTMDRPRLLKEALESVAGQTYRPIEAVIVNDGGADVADATSPFRETLTRVKCVQLERNLGRAAAANRGIAEACGLWIGFLDDDDLLESGAVEALVAASTRSQARVVYGRVVREHYLEDGCRDPSRPDYLYGRPFDRNLLFFQNYIPFIGLLFHRSVLDACGPLDEGLLLNEDWDLLLRAAAVSQFLHVPILAAHYRCFGSATAAGGRFTQEEILAAEDMVRRRWWDRIPPETVHAFRAYVSEETARQCSQPPDATPVAGKSAVEPSVPERSIEKLTARVARAEAERDFLKKQTRMMEGSLSWRLTAPLRLLRALELKARETLRHRAKKKCRPG